MTNLTAAPSFDDVVQLETTTAALAGPGGPMNLQAQALLNRTAYLAAQKANSADLAASTGAGLVGLRRTDLADSIATTLAIWHDAQFVNMVADYGCVGDGVTDNSAKISSAIANSDGHTLFFGPGTFLCSGIVITGLTGVHIVGASPYSTILKLKNASNTHVVAYSGAVDCSIQNITLDGNYLNQTGGHGVRLGGIDGLTLNNIRIQNCYSYAVGAQAGTNKRVTVSNFHFKTLGQDGIDIKDYDLANENIVICNGIIEDYGKLELQQVGIDIRGPAAVSNIAITCQNTDTRGFRLRSASGQGRHGSGTASNLVVNMTDTSAGTYALDISSGVTNYSISNVSTRGGFLGVIDGIGGLLKNLSCDSTIGTDALSIFATDTIIDGLNIDGCARGIDFEPSATGNRISNFNIKTVSGAEAIRIQATADNTVLTQGFVQSGKLISDAGTNTIIRDVKNWKTAARIISADLLVDSTGTKTAVLTHDLAVTPNAEDITLTVIRSTGSPSDYRIGLLHIDSVSSTVINVRTVVTTASGTAGAAIKLAATVRAKNA